MSVINELKEAFSSKTPEHVRNVCLIAHVDHGKTSLADSLVSCNAIVSSRLAGKVRFMDSREDEQTRGITMKSSGCSILYGPLLVNLMDSPGHVDFSSEVTTAIALSDISLLLVDVVEGVCSQTQSLLRQAITSGQSIILVLNKLDRLRVELKMTANEAYNHISRLIENINSRVGSIVAGILLEDDESWKDLEKVEEKLQFDPTKGNVLFSSAVHGYGFSLEDFAEMYADKLKMDKTTLVNGLFGDFFMSGNTIKSGASEKGKKTLFEQMILEPLWTLHDCGLVTNDLEKLVDLAAKLGVVCKSRRVSEAFDEVMRNWLPIPRACFRSCARKTSAKNAFADKIRLQRLLKSSDHPLSSAISSCDPTGVTVAYVVKFVRIEERQLAICRLFSGKISKNDQLFVLGAKERAEGTSTMKTNVSNLFILRGRDTIPIETASAGAIFALEAKGLILGATLCSEEVSTGIALEREMGEPLVRVTINPPDLSQMEELKEALKLLAVLDPSVRVFELETGDLALVTAGEVHLQKCVKDLESLGFMDLEVSNPIVPFLETIVADPSFTSVQIESQITECHLRGDALSLQLRAVPLPREIVEIMDKYKSCTRNCRLGKTDDEQVVKFKNELLTTALAVLPKMKGSWWHRKTNEEIEQLIEKIWSFGPDAARCNILFNDIPDYDRNSIWDKSEGTIRPFDQSLISGFELFVNKGPLANESMTGVAIVVSRWVLDEEDSVATGQIMSAMRATCKAATEKVGLRLVAAMYKCLISTASQSLGKVHAVLSQRKAKVLSEDINEATGLFEVQSLLPVIESFSFCDQLRKMTSGMASADMTFSHWQVIDEDPYWTPSTLEEIEEFGLKGDSPNHARGYMDAIRRRKGLPTEDLIVASAEKQRNLKRNK